MYSGSNRKWGQKVHSRIFRHISTGYGARAFKSLKLGALKSVGAAHDP